MTTFKVGDAVRVVPEFYLGNPLPPNTTGTVAGIIAFCVYSVQLDTDGSHIYVSPIEIELVESNDGMVGDEDF